MQSGALWRWSGDARNYGLRAMQAFCNCGDDGRCKRVGCCVVFFDDGNDVVEGFCHLFMRHLGAGVTSAGRGDIGSGVGSKVEGENFGGGERGGGGGGVGGDVGDGRYFRQYFLFFSEGSGVGGFRFLCSVRGVSSGQYVGERGGGVGNSFCRRRFSVFCGRVNGDGIWRVILGLGII